MTGKRKLERQNTAEACLDSEKNPRIGCDLPYPSLLQAASAVPRTKRRQIFPPKKAGHNPGAARRQP